MEESDSFGGVISTFEQSSKYALMAHGGSPPTKGKRYLFPLALMAEIVSFPTAAPKL